MLVRLMRRRRCPSLLVVAWPSISSNSPLTWAGPSTCICTWAPRLLVVLLLFLLTVPLLLLQPGSLPWHRNRRAAARPCWCCRIASCISAAATRDRRRPPPNERADAE